MKIKLKDLLKECIEFELSESELDKNKLDLITNYLSICVMEGILKSNSPQFTMLLRQAMVYSKSE